MSEKPKRKYHYRRWWAFRGLLIALIVFLGAIGYLLTRQPRGEYLYFNRDGNLWRISTIADATPELIGEMSVVAWNKRVAANWLIYSTGEGIPTEIRHINLITGEDSLLLDCRAIALGGRCLSFDLQPGGNLLVYNFYYTTPEPPYEFFEVRLFNIEQNTDIGLFEVTHWLFEMRWVNDHQIEYTTALHDLWSYNVDTGANQQIDLTNYRLFSPDSSQYIARRFNTQYSRWYFEYTVYDTNQMPVEGYQFITESDSPICWQPNSDGVLYHDLSTIMGNPINRASYYDIGAGRSHSLFEEPSYEVTFASWSPSGHFVLIQVSSGNQDSRSYLYDMESNTGHWLTGISELFWSDEMSHCWLSFPPG